MTVSRRLFLKAASAGTLLASLPQTFVNVFGQDKRKPIQGAPTGDGTLGIPVSRDDNPLFYYNSAAFSSCVGSTFRVYVSQRKYVGLKLVEVSQLEPAIPGKDGFVLVFEDSAPKRLRGGLYTIEHAALGTFSMMLGPVSRSGTSYEAVINRQYP